MDYNQAFERFDLDKFIVSLTDKNYLEMLNSLNKEIRNVETIKIPTKSQYKRDVDYLHVNYIFDLKGLSFLLGQGMKPSGVKIEILKKFKPILEELVKKRTTKRYNIKTN